MGMQCVRAKEVKLEDLSINKRTYFPIPNNKKSHLKARPCKRV